MTRYVGQDRVTFTGTSHAIVKECQYIKLAGRQEPYLRLHGSKHRGASGFEMVSFRTIASDYYEPTHFDGNDGSHFTCLQGSLEKFWC